jgi:hypothetical protein
VDKTPSVWTKHPLDAESAPKSSETDRQIWGGALSRIPNLEIGQAVVFIIRFRSVFIPTCVCMDLSTRDRA